jgi:hypothetical protein
VSNSASIPNERTITLSHPIIVFSLWAIVIIVESLNSEEMSS